MKSKTILFLSLFFSSLLIAQNDTHKTVIEGFITGLPAGKTKLVGMFGDQNYLADSAVVDETGYFALRRTTQLPAGLYTFLLPGSKNFSCLIDENDQHVIFRGNAADLNGTMKVEGSLNTELLFQTNRYQMAQEREINQLTETMKKAGPGNPEYVQAKARQDLLIAERKTYLEGIFKQYPNTFFTKFKLAGQNPEFKELRKPNGQIDTIGQVVYYRDRFWDNVDFNDPRLLYTPVISNKLKRYIKDLTPQRPDSLIKVSDALVRRVMPYPEYFKFFANWIALQYENTKTTVMDGEAVYVHIVQNFFTDELAVWEKPENLKKLRQHVWEMEASLLGKKGPDVIAADMNGQLRSIYELKSPLVVVFMFNPDCEHCQKEAAEVEAIYKKWKGKGVDFYGIAVNTTESEWKEFVVKNGFTFINVFDPTNRAIYAKYFVDITPELYLLNKDRTIVGKNLHANQLEQLFEKELKKMN